MNVRGIEIPNQSAMTVHIAPNGTAPVEPSCQTMRLRTKKIEKMKTGNSVDWRIIVFCHDVPPCMR